jgi:GT2 family glycosyltransferase
MSGLPLAVVVLSYRNEETIVAAVESLLAQDEAVDIVVSHSGGGRTPALLDSYAPKVGVVATERRRLPGAARNAGIAATAAPHVAFLAGDCLAQPGWAAGRLARHRAGAPAIASAMVPLERTPAALASYVIQHSSRMPHLVDPAPKFRYGLSYARSVLDRHGPFPEALLIGEDSVMKERLIDAGVEIGWAPEVLTAHAYPTTVRGLVADQYRRGRRRAPLAAGASRRAALLAQVLLEPAQGLWRATRPGSAIDRVEFVRVAPLVWVAGLASLVGVLRGGARA